MHQLKIKHWIYLAAIFFSFLPLLISFIISYQTTYSQLLSSVYQTNSAYSELKTAYLSQYFKKIDSNANVIAKSDSISVSIMIMNDPTEYETIRNEAETKLHRFLDAAESDLEYADIFLTDTNGIVIYGDSVVLDADLSERNYIQTALTGTQNWSELFYSKYLSKNVMVLSTPVYQYSNSVTPIATLNIVISQNILDNKVHKEVDIIGETGNAYLVDKNGLLWTNTMFGSYQHDSALVSTIQTPIMSGLSAALQSGKTNYKQTAFYRGYDGNNVFGACGVISIGDSDLGIIIEVNASEALTSINQFRIIYLSFFCMIILLTLIVIKVFTNNIRKPLVAIDQYANYIVQDKLEEELPNNILMRKDEFGTIAMSIKTIANHLIEYGKCMEYQAEHDFLTNIPNRRAFISYLKTELAATQAGAIVLLDLDNFKEINDTLGHVYGDLILSAFAKRLSEIYAKEKDIFIARYGGDEFLILFKSYQNMRELNNKIHIIETQLRQAYPINEEMIKINFCSGISLYPQNANDSFDLLTYADIAMHKAKLSISDTRLYYDPTMYDHLKRKHDIKNILSDAIKNDGFELFYQPQLDLRTGSINSFEALLRLKDYKIGPGEFIPVAEENTHLIIAIGRWVTETAIRQIAEWNKKGYSKIKVAINFSIKQMEDEQYINFLNSMIKKYEIDKSLLSIEVTESIFLENSSLQIAFLSSLNNTGIDLELDDFGSGYSSLKYLTHFNLNVIKLDKEFNDYFISQKRFDTLKHVIELFHSLDLLVVAEGIEEPENCSLYHTIHCDYIQSYCISRPLPKTDAEKWINKKIEV